MADWDDEFEWTEEAKDCFRKIPFFVRTQARQSIEALARERDCDKITLDLVEEARQGFGK